MKRIKPILVKRDQAHIDVGDLNLPNIPNKINEGKLGIAVRSFMRNDAYSVYDVILIDNEAEIVEGYAYSEKGTPSIQQIDGNVCHDRRDFGWNKIISSTAKSHNLPDLSNKSKLLLINYYNEYKCMPESVDIEMIKNTEDFGCDPAYFGEPSHVITNQQGEVDITIPEVRRSIKDCVASHEGDTQYKEKKLYTEEEVLVLMRSYLDHYRFVDKRIINPEEFLKKRKRQ